MYIYIYILCIYIYTHYVNIYILLAGWWFGTFFAFHFIYGIILPIDELIFLKMVETTNQYVYIYILCQYIHITLR